MLFIRLKSKLIKLSIIKQIITCKILNFPCTGINLLDRVHETYNYMKY